MIAEKKGQREAEQHRQAEAVDDARGDIPRDVVGAQPSAGR